MEIPFLVKMKMASNLLEGLLTYNTHDLKRIMGKQTSEIEKVLGYYYYNEVIHRDNLL